MRAALNGLDEGEFTEGHELDRKWRVAKEMIGRRLSQAEAKRLLAEFAVNLRASTHFDNRVVVIVIPTIYVAVVVCGKKLYMPI